MPLDEAVISFFNQTSNCNLKTLFNEQHWRREGGGIKKGGLNRLFLHHCVINSASTQNDYTGRKEGEAECRERDDG